jgi:hypothetical protein
MEQYETKVLKLIELAREWTELRDLDFDSYIDGLFNNLDLESDLIHKLISYHKNWLT